MSVTGELTPLPSNQCERKSACPMTIPTPIKTCGDSTPSPPFHGCLGETSTCIISVWIVRTRALTKERLTSFGIRLARGFGGENPVGTTISNSSTSSAASAVATFRRGQRRPRRASLSIDLSIRRNLILALAWDCFWRENTHDGIYGPAVNLIQSGQTSDARYVGHQAEITLEWRIDRHFWLTADYAHFFAGDFLKQNTPGKDVDYASIWVTYRF